jgi:hypothetical protein
MPERSKSHLKQEFRDGERPTGADFADFIDSYVSKVDDQVTVDVATHNLVLAGGVSLGNPGSGADGTLRFSAGNLQVSVGGVWNNVGGGGGGAFLPVGGGPHVAFSGGNVGIGNFAVAPTFKLEVELGNNVGTGDRAKFGNAVLANGNGVFASSAQFSHTDHSAGNNNYALRQTATGEVNINAPSTQSINITHNRTSPRIFISPSGPTVIGSNALLPGTNPATHLLQVGGDAFKTAGGTAWAVPSDVRYKKDVKDFKDGLEKLMQVRTVRFKYSGLPGKVSEDHEEVGIIGQEMQEIFPYMISQGSVNNENQSGKKDDVLMYNGSALTFVMVNAIQELTNRVKELEAQLKEARKE